jgi:hypothetical protein
MTISAAVNWDTRLIAMLPPVRIAMFLASVPNVGCDEPLLARN